MTIAPLNVATVIVGTGFSGLQAIHAVERMRPGEEIRLVREPDNAFDRNAVACHYLGVHVGYVPRQANPKVALALDEGLTLSATCAAPAVVRLGRVRVEPKITITWGEDDA